MASLPVRNALLKGVLPASTVSSRFEEHPNLLGRQLLYSFTRDQCQRLACLFHSRRPNFTSRHCDCCVDASGCAPCSGPRRPNFSRRHFCRGTVLCDPRRPGFTNSFCHCCVASVGHVRRSAVLCDPRGRASPSALLDCCGAASVVSLPPDQEDPAPPEDHRESLAHPPTVLPSAAEETRRTAPRAHLRTSIICFTRRWTVFAAGSAHSGRPPSDKRPLNDNWIVSQDQPTLSETANKKKNAFLLEPLEPKWVTWFQQNGNCAVVCWLLLEAPECRGQLRSSWSSRRILAGSSCFGTED